VLSPLQNPIWFQTISHKGLRLTIPLLHATLFVANLGVVRKGFAYRLMMGGQFAFYAAGLAGHLLRSARYRPLIFTVPYAMCLLCSATVGGFVRFVTHRQHAKWGRAYPAPRITASAAP
jgi:hypothetical protein